MKTSAKASLFTLLSVLLMAPPLLSGCKDAGATVQAKEEPAVGVVTTPVTLVDTPRRLLLTGTLKGDRETDLAANVAGKVLSTQVERGQSIEKGELIAQVDTQAAQLALREAKTNVATSETQESINRTECERYEKLKQAGVVTALEYDQATAKCKTAPLQLEAAMVRQSIAAKNVGDGRIVAPFSGVVTERSVEVGEYVQASTRVISLAQIAQLRVVFQVPERHFPDIKSGAEVLVKVAAYENEKFSGKVAHVSAKVSATRDIVVEAIVDNPESRLLPGMFAQVELTIGTEKLPSVPKSAVFTQNEKANVYVAVGQQLEQRVVSLGPTEGDRIVVVRGLKEGEHVVPTLSPDLKNGLRIKAR